MPELDCVSCCQSEDSSAEPDNRVKLLRHVPSGSHIPWQGCLTTLPFTLDSALN